VDDRVAEAQQYSMSSPPSALSCGRGARWPRTKVGTAMDYSAPTICPVEGGRDALAVNYEWDLESRGDIGQFLVVTETVSCSTRCDHDVSWDGPYARFMIRQEPLLPSVLTTCRASMITDSAGGIRF
jgi:hypothetical protein